MEKVKQFFSIEGKYAPEWGDLAGVLTITNVTLIVCGVWFAPLFGLANCALSAWNNIKSKAHINAHLITLALIVLNIYFLM